MNLDRPWTRSATELRPGWTRTHDMAPYFAPERTMEVVLEGFMLRRERRGFSDEEWRRVWEWVEKHFLDIFLLEGILDGQLDVDVDDAGELTFQRVGV